MTYEHRNGESAAPTIEGEYWFAGVCTDKYGPDGEIKELTIVKLIPAGAAWAGWRVELPIQNSDEDCRYNTEINSLQGRWWGPVFAPWNEKEAGDASKT